MHYEVETFHPFWSKIRSNNIILEFVQQGVTVFINNKAVKTYEEPTDRDIGLILETFSQTEPPQSEEPWAQSLFYGGLTPHNVAAITGLDDSQAQKFCDIVQPKVSDGAIVSSLYVAETLGLSPEETAAIFQKLSNAGVLRLHRSIPDRYPVLVIKGACVSPIRDFEPLADEDKTVCAEILERLIRVQSLGLIDVRKIASVDKERAQQLMHLVDEFVPDVRYVHQDVMNNLYCCAQRLDQYGD